MTEMFPINFPQKIMGLCFHDRVMYAVGLHNTLVKYDPETGRQLGVISPLIPELSESHFHGISVASNDTFWIADVGTWQRVFHLQFSDYTMLSVVDVPLGAWIYAVLYEDQFLWIGRHSDGTYTTPIQALDSTTGQVVGTFDFGSVDVHGMVSVAGYKWVLDNDVNSVYRIDCSGRVCEQFDLPGDLWGSLGFDGSHFWTSNRSAFYRFQLPIPSTVEQCGTGEPPTTFDVCAAAIPTVAAWGIAEMALLILIAGTIAVRSRRHALSGAV